MKGIMTAAVTVMCLAITVAVVQDMSVAQLTPEEERAVAPQEGRQRGIWRSGSSEPRCSVEQLGWLGKVRVTIFDFPKACYE